MSRWHNAPLNRRRWARVRLRIMDRDGWRCVLCGKAGRLEVDHVRPLHHGGEQWAESNLQTLCKTCHVAKSRRESGRPVSPKTAQSAHRWAALVDAMRDSE